MTLAFEQGGEEKFLIFAIGDYQVINILEELVQGVGSNRLSERDIQYFGLE